MGPHGGHLYHMNTFESPAPEGWFLPSLVKIQLCISSSSTWTVTFYIGPPPQPVTHMGAIGATLGSATNNLYSSPNYTSHNLDYRFYLNWIWRKKVWNLQSFGPGGPPLGPPIRSHMYHMNNFESPAPKDDSCHVWLKSNHAFSKRRWNSYFLQRVAQVEAHWGHPGNCHEQLLFFI